MRKARRKQKGMTITELMTTLAVIGVSVSIAVPSYRATMNNNRRTAAINALYQTSQTARSEAITRNVQVTICPSASGNNCEAVGWNQGWIFFADLDRSRSVNGAETVLGVVAERPRLTISSAEFGNFYAYRPNGRVIVNAVAENTGDLVICDERGADEARVLSIDTSGQPRIGERMLNGAAPACPA
jgi:type IV fimbrial biogenesis protein FimT